MTDSASLETRIAEITRLLHQKLGVKGGTLTAALKPARRHLPRHIRHQADRLAAAERFADHPKLRLTLATGDLGQAADEVGRHLKAIDLADRRLGWWLGMLGGLAVNILLWFALLIVVLRWRGFL
ncbi:hypothetical protein [Pseudodonghicola flavimaris]|uniref:DUF3618 domain-containing protein n=1 Tax=Pseudodonghicola flavimaris TaxID=3050036 RepID=A0ABT7F647_9RHOB|nr:hypothetical protein [Pseudodonghicola flavimaris]MDK3019985.1 hypothetical protein [Pseudodonghicola flavimaris]